jgi:ArsR family transcriptional regulator
MWDFALQTLPSPLAVQRRPGVAVGFDVHGDSGNLRDMSNSRSFDVDRLSLAFKALASSHRLRIFLRLMDCCPPGTCRWTDPEACRCVGDLGHDLGIAASTVSHHLKVLHHSGLIRMERRGQTVQCWIDPEMIAELGSFFAELRTRDSASVCT